MIVIEALIVDGARQRVHARDEQQHVGEGEARPQRTTHAFAATYIVSDAANSSGPETSLSDTASCPDAEPARRRNRRPRSCASTGTARARPARSTANVVNYVLVSNSLLRRQCRNGTLVSDTVLATNIASVTVACSPTANCTGTPTTITATRHRDAGIGNGGADVSVQPHRRVPEGPRRRSAAPSPLSISGPAIVAGVDDQPAVPVDDRSTDRAAAARTAGRRAASRPA